MGVAYGKLGLATDADLIKRRGEGIQKAVSGVDRAGLVALLQAVFDIGSGDARFAFLSAFKDDLTFDVRPGDKEAFLLAGAVADLVMEGSKKHGAYLALATVACAFAGKRRPAHNDELVSLARGHLAKAQGSGGAKPAERKYLMKPDDLTAAIAAVPSGHPSFTSSGAQVIQAMTAIANYAEAVANFQANSERELLAYINHLEAEMRVHWWVTGGWSSDAEKPFAQLALEVAAVCAGDELASMHSGVFGLFAAPALIDLVLERGRPSSQGEIVLANTAKSILAGWRKTKCAAVASGGLAALLPVTTALGLSAESDDADDWKPRFKRVTGIDAEAALPATDLALQFYLERLVARALI